MSRSMVDRVRQRLRRPRHALWLSPVAQPGAVPPAEFEAWCRDHAGASVTLWWAAAGQQLLDIDPALPLSDAQRPGYARGVFAHYGGHATDAAALALWRSGSHHGACLAPGLDVVALRSVARRHRVRLQRVLPLWVGRLEQALLQRPSWCRQERAVVLALEGPLLVALALERGHLLSARLLRLDAATPAALHEAWRSLGWPGPVLLLGHGLVATLPLSGMAKDWKVLGQLQAEVPDLETARRSVLDSAPDFAAPAMPRARRLGWWAAAAAAALCLVASLDAWLSFAERAQAQQREQALQQRLALLQRRETRPPAAAPMPRAWPAGLYHPWGTLLASVEGASDGGVRWLVLEHSADRPTLRLAGLADDMAALMRVSERLSAQTSWRDVLPARIQAAATAEPPPAAAGASAVPGARGGVSGAGLRFELTALYLAPGPAAQGPAP